VPLALVSVGLIGLMLAQIKKQPRIYFPYIFLAAVACSVLVDLTGLISLEREAALFLPLLIVLSVASFAEYHAREVHKSHLWTAACTGIITISYWILTAFTMGVASV